MMIKTKFFIYLFLIISTLVKTNLVIADSVITEKISSQLKYISEAYKRGNYHQIISLKNQLNPHPTLLQYLSSSYANLGQFDEAIYILKNLLEQPLEISMLSAIKANLAQLLLEKGKLDEAEQLALEAFELTNNNLSRKGIISGILGNIYAKKGRYQKATSYYNQGLSQLNDSAKLNVLNNLITTQKMWIEELTQDVKWAKIWNDKTTSDLLQKINSISQEHQTTIEKSLQLSQNLRGINFLRTQILLKNKSKLSENQLFLRVKQLPLSLTKGELFLKLNQPQAALEVAQQLQDYRLLSFSLGALGEEFKSKGDLSKASTLFLEAQQSAFQIGAWDSLYLWQWESAKIYLQQEDTEKALLYYNKAIDTLSHLRPELAAIRQQVKFTKDVEPLYLEALKLGLEQAKSSVDLQNIKEILKQYQIALVENYFNSPCPLELDSISVKLEKGQAFIYFISLPQKTYIILELPDNKLSHYQLDLTQSELQELATKWRSELTLEITEDYRETSQIFYKKLILPIEEKLINNKIDTLLIQPSDALQNLPLAALWDGKNYLIEKYNLAFSLGLRQNNSIKTVNNTGKIFGLSTPSKADNSDLSDLPGVAREVQQIQYLTNAKIWIDDSFTYENFSDSVTQKEDNISFLHLATHGRFGGNASQSWLLTYDHKMFLPELETLLLKSNLPVSLLVLSGCETAVGNDRTISGMAGLAIRTGVGNVISSLWRVGDTDSADLIPNFYRFYQQEYSPIEALRKAQLSMLQSDSHHPYDWAGYVVLVP